MTTQHGEQIVGVLKAEQKQTLVGDAEEDLVDGVQSLALFRAFHIKLPARGRRFVDCDWPLVVQHTFVRQPFNWISFVLVIAINRNFDYDFANPISFELLLVADLLQSLQCTIDWLC